MPPTPYFADEQTTLWHGDSLDILRQLPDASVDCCVTSPPYFGLRDYGEVGQYGLEASPAEYVETMRAVFAEVRRVLADDGTLWLNLGDSYSAKRTYQVDQSKVQRSRIDQPYDTTAFLPAKNLMLVPHRVAMALQDDGWILRNDIIWHKANGMPESITDRVSTRHEHVFMLSKSARYWFDLDPIREPHSAATLKRAEPHRAAPGKSRREGLGIPPGNRPHTARLDQTNHPNGRNPGDVWTLPTQPFTEAHFAVMPQALAERAILAGCKPGGVVLDPFSGSGTTGLAAAKHGRKYVGIDLSADYLDLSLRTRLAQPGLDFGEASA
jgi:site-specific DNA-methyltransferase (cytosine-N4-specific)